MKCKSGRYLASPYRIVSHLYANTEEAMSNCRMHSVEFGKKRAVMAVDIRCPRGEFQFMAAYKYIQEGPRHTASAPIHR
jgi:hypothetical protein